MSESPLLPAEIRDVAAEVVTALRARRATVATAESLTGGLVVAALTTVPGASEVVRGGVCAYHSDVKAALVGVSVEALQSGAVNARVAEELAEGSRTTFGVDYGIGTTGVAGPDPSDGCAVGTVFVAVAGPGPRSEAGSVSAPHATVSRRLALTGSRDDIRENTVREVLRMLAEVLAR
ncbi:MAG: nicotinamide-nucleotide amidohydrolase family protein [Dermatophilus congolensis]|nr:nicotinamide-nucleotide amidohydrolase family protein [Dermatophilus congolensis]